MSNGVRARRDELGMPQKGLAAAVGVSRQSLNAIETARAQPSVALALRLARALGSDVEALFGGELREEVEAELASAARVGTRVLVSSVRGRWVAHPFGTEALSGSPYAADGFVRAVKGTLAQTQLVRRPRDVQDTVLVSGCAPALGVLADRLDGGLAGGRFRWLMHASNAAMRALAQGHVHVAGVHLPERAPKQLERLVARHLPVEHGTIYAFANWDAGLVVPRGNPGRVRDVRAIENARVRVAMREPGSGARTQFARLLRAAGFDIAELAPRSVATFSHMAVAQAVQLGAADVGFAIRAAALAYELDFIPLVQERFDLVVPSDLAGDARIRRMLELLNSAPFRCELEALGYDARAAGQKIQAVTAS